MVEPQVQLADLQQRAVELDQVKAAAISVLRAEGRTDVDLSLTLVDDARMTELHGQYSGDPTPTDVLAFPLQEDGGPAIPGLRPLLGEVVVSTDTAAREADARGLPFSRELLLYVIHGTLHLLGYDDHDPELREKMHARQEELLEAFLTS